MHSQSHTHTQTHIHTHACTHTHTHTHTHSNTCTCNLSSAGILSAWYVNTTGLQYLRPSFLACLRTSYSYWTITGSAIAQGYRPLLPTQREKLQHTSANRLSISVTDFSVAVFCMKAHASSVLSVAIWLAACSSMFFTSSLVGCPGQHNNTHTPDTFSNNTMPLP